MQLEIEINYTTTTTTTTATATFQVKPTSSLDRKVRINRARVFRVVLVTVSLW
jgi:hypothetical protein